MEETKAAEQMLCLRFKAHGSSSALKIEEVERPMPLRGQLLIKVIAFSLNPLDIKLLNNPLAELMMKLPHVPARDFSGIVVENSAVDSSFYQIGSVVMGMTPNAMKNGAACEYLCIAEEYITLCPRRSGVRFDPVALSSVPLVGLTVVEALHPYRQHLGRKGETTVGKRILIHGGSGGVGSFAVQYCRKALGMYVTSTCSLRNNDFVKSLGANEVMAYASSVSEEVWYKNSLCFNQDVVLDPFSYRNRKITLASDDILTNQGWYIDIASSPHRLTDAWKDPLGLCVPEAAAPNLIDAAFTGVWTLLTNWWERLINLNARARQYKLFFVQPSGRFLRQVRDAVVAGHVDPCVQKIFHFTTTDCRDAFDLVEESHVRGKLVVQVDDH
jgi:alcohol dehydrogenase